MIKIANAQFWVHDQDEALAFYTQTLGWEVRADVTMEAWNFRWLCVGPVGQHDVGLVLMPVPGPPMLDPDDSASLAELVAKGAGARCSSRPTTVRPATRSSRPEASLQRPADGPGLRHRHVVPGSVGQQHPAHPSAGVRPG